MEALKTQPVVIDDPADMITNNLDAWTAAIQTRSSAGRGSSKKLDLYGIKKLRGLILELAVRGKLVPQDPNDEPASVLLEHIACEKAQLVKEKKIKKQKALPKVSEDEKTFDLPAGWEWIRLGELFNSIMSGGTPSKREHSFWAGDIPWASVKDLGKERYITKTEDYITQSGLDAGSKLADIGDILICTRMGLGKVGVANVPLAFNQDLKSVKLSSLVDVEHFLNTYSTIKIKGTGTTVAGIKQEQLLGYVVGLPPLAEQHRIVAKVDELMALCDQLEQQTEASIDAHVTLVETLLGTLLQPTAAAEDSLTDSAAERTTAKDGGSVEPAGASFDQNWTRIADHFDTLFTTDHAIDQLKQTVLQLAVMGKLVPQDPNDEPAAVLLKKIAAEKAQLVKEKKIKKQKPLPPIAEDEKPFALPDGWEWCRFSTLSNEVATGPFGSMINKKEYIDGGVPLVNPSHMINSKIVGDSSISVTETKAQELGSYRIFENDIVMARRGEMGRCALVTEREHNWLCGTGSFVLRFNEAVSRPYILLLFKTNWTKGYLGGNSIGTTMVNLNHGIINKMPLLLPPQAEQARIVAKVDQLMTLCDQLKARLQHAQQTQLHLADAMVEQAVR